nr:2-alkenal reductase [Tanacetum cinerariifolium]
MDQVVKNKQIIFKDYVNGFPKESDMFLNSSETNKLKLAQGSNGVLVKNLYLSCDPYMRNRMNKTQGEYFESFTPGSPISGLGVAKVLDSGHLDFKTGDLVSGGTGWEEYSIINEPETLFKIQHTDDVPLSYYTGFDMPVFSLLPYPDLSLIVCRYFPNGIDIYFDNVGGKMLDAVLLNMRLNGRVSVCGMISQYNLEQREGLRNLFTLVTKRVRMEGFIVVDYYHVYPKYLEMIMPLIKQGTVHCIQDIADGLESAPAALVGLFSGKNVGKQVVAVADEYNLYG